MSLGLAVLSTAFLLGCEPEDLGVLFTPDEGLRTVTVGVSAEGAGTKAEIDNDLVFSWTAGDRIAVWAGSEGSGQYYESDAYAGGNTYQISLSGTRSNYAVYPAGIEVSDAATASSLKVKLPNEYDFTAVGADYSPLPMIAVNNEGQDLAFMHLGGLLRITLGDLPAGTTYVTVDLGKPINGTFPVHLESNGSYISCEDETITGGSNVTKFLVPSPVPDNMVLNLPVPTGSYESVTVTAYDGDNNVLGSDSPTFSWTCARAHGKKLTDDDLGWVYVFGSLTDGTVPYSGGDVTLASGFQSYRYRGETQEIVPYVVEYSLDGETWSTEAPDWLTGAPTSSTGSIDGEDLALTVAPQVNSTPDPHHTVLAGQNAKSGFDLSTLNVATGEPVSRSTANCYVVQAPGTYKFPLVYGNGVKNGAVNESAYRAKAGVNATEYRPDDGIQYYLGRFKDHLDQNIMSPYIATQQPGKALSATLIWTDALGLVTDVALSGTGENTYLTFSVPAETITQGNALVAVLVDDDVDGTPETIAWSWHIWVTDVDLTDVKEASNGFKLPTVNLGWCEGTTETYAERTLLVRSVQKQSNKVTGSVTIKETAASITTLGNEPFYQWGRKDPIQASAGKQNTNKTYYPSTSEYTPHYETGPTTLGQAIQAPYKYFWRSSNWASTVYNNLWSSTINGATPNNGQNINANTKTIYDPSPVGFRLPSSAAFLSFTEENCTSTTIYGQKAFVYDNTLVFLDSGHRANNFNHVIQPSNAISCLWYATANANINGNMFSYDPQTYTPHTSNAGNPKAQAYSVRPVVDN